MAQKPKKAPAVRRISGTTPRPAMTTKTFGKAPAKPADAPEEAKSSPAPAAAEAKPAEKKPVDTIDGLGNGQQVPASHVHASMMAQTILRDLPLDKIRDRGNQVRKELNSDTLNELKRSIERQGVLEPILVTSLNSEGYFTILAGHRRVAAARLAGLKTIPAVIRENPDVWNNETEKKWRIDQISENIHRENLNPVEIGQTLKELLDYGLSLSEMEVALSKSKSWISRFIQIAALPDYAQKYIAAYGVTSVPAYKLSQLAKEDPDAVKKLVFIGESEGIALTRADFEIDYETRYQAALMRLSGSGEETPQNIDEPRIKTTGDDDDDDGETPISKPVTPEKPRRPKKPAYEYYYLIKLEGQELLGTMKKPKYIRQDGRVEVTLDDYDLPHLVPPSAMHFMGVREKKERK